MAKKQSYLTTGLATVEVGQDTYPNKGQTVELTPDQAQPLLAKGYLVRPPTKRPAAGGTDKAGG